MAEVVWQRFGRGLAEVVFGAENVRKFERIRRSTDGQRILPFRWRQVTYFVSTHLSAAFCSGVTDGKSVVLCLKEFKCLIACQMRIAFVVIDNRFIESRQHVLAKMEWRDSEVPAGVNDGSKKDRFKMSSTICEPIQNAQRQTDSVCRDFDSWLEARRLACDQTRKLVDLWIEVVNAWKVVAEIIQSSKLECSELKGQSIGVVIQPYLEKLKKCYQIVEAQRVIGAGFECGAAFSKEYSRAIYDMDRIAIYFESLRIEETEERLHFETMRRSSLDIAFEEAVVSPEGSSRFKMALASGRARPTNTPKALPMR